MENKIIPLDNGDLFVKPTRFNSLEITTLDDLKKYLTKNYRDVRAVCNCGSYPDIIDTDNPVMGICNNCGVIYKVVSDE